ncbi:MAG: divergent polysaccharide deacetylase family protein, partial [Pseudomonadales bacterium]
LALAHGTSLAIGHPYPQTLSVLRNVLSKPSYYGVELVSVRELIARRTRASQAASSSSQNVGWGELAYL